MDGQRKVYCEVVESAVYEDRCLFRLCKVVKDNRACERCIVRELEGLKGRRKKTGKKPDAGAARENEASSDKFYTSEMVAKVLGKDPRTIRKLAKKGEIPSQKMGKEYRFPREEFERWLSEKKT